MSKNVTIGFQLANHPNKRGLYPIMIRITQERVSKRIRSPLEVKKEDWNQKSQQFRKSARDAKVNNARLEDIRHEYLMKYRELEKQGSVSIDQFTEKGQVKETSFLSYAKKVVEDIRVKGKYRDYKKLFGFVRKFEMFLSSIKKKDIKFSELTTALMTNYETFLCTLRNERQPEKVLHANTIIAEFKIFKRIIKKAVRDDLITSDENPFMKFELSTKAKPVYKEGLDLSEIEKMEALDLREGTLIWHTRNAFLFSFYSRGMRSEDVLQLKWRNITNDGDRIHYVMGKNHKPITNILVEQAKDILNLYHRGDNNQYIFPFLDKHKVWATYSIEEIEKMPFEIKEQLARHIDSGRSKMNKNLKEIAAMCGITKKLTMHIARHSFAQLAVASGSDTVVIKNLLAHSKLDETDRYCSNYGSTIIDAEMLKIFGRKQQEDISSDKMELIRKLTEQLKTLILQG